MKIAQKFSSLTDTIVSIAKAIPLIAGAAGGLVVAPPGWGESSPVQRVMDGDWKTAIEAATLNYTFFDPSTGKFNFGEGIGVKMLGAGIIAHKVIGWVAE
jgi:hypothetical protein